MEEKNKDTINEQEKETVSTEEELTRADGSDNIPTEAQENVTDENADGTPPEQSEQIPEKKDCMEKISENEYTLNTPSYSPIAKQSEYARWNYSSQLDADKRARKKSEKGSGLVFAGICAGAFLGAAITLIVAMIFGTKLYDPEKVVYQDRIIYVREDGKTEGSLSIPEIAQKLDPSIVFIDVVTEKGSGTATGIIMSSDGYIVTNAHVIEDATSINITLNSGDKYKASLCGADYIADLAVIKAEGANALVPAEFGSSDDLVVGESVVAIGCPAGYTNTTTEGIISAVNRTIDIEDSTGRLEKTMTLLQTNANINPGNSGGALLDMDGKVIGITTLKLVQSDAGINYDGLGFAIPISTAMPIIESLKKGEPTFGGEVASKVPSLGVTGTIVVKDQINPYDEQPSPESGFFVAEVAKDSSADGVIKVGDIIISVDGIKVVDVEVIRDLLKLHKAGDVINVVVYSEGETKTIPIILR